MLRILGAAAAGAAIALGAREADLLPAARPPTVAHAEDLEGNEVVGRFKSSGLLFKDTVKVSAFPDPKVSGLTLHLSYVDRALDPFGDSSIASLSLAQTGPLRILEPLDTSLEGEEVFSKRRNWLFKDIRVRRIYDRKTNSLVYVSYSTRIFKEINTPHSLYKTSIAAVGLWDKDVHPDAKK
eukprot:tig00021571_g22373.t1